MADPECLVVGDGISNIAHGIISQPNYSLLVRLHTHNILKTIICGLNDVDDSIIQPNQHSIGSFVIVDA